MLLVTFHGGSSGINNIYGYGAPTGPNPQTAALVVPNTGLSELRAMVMANGLLYVANGAKSQSTVLAYSVPSTPPSSGPWFTNPSVLIGPTIGKKGFETSIAHPFGIAWENATTCFISNQDTNVVSQVTVTNGVGSLGKGCQSAYLKKEYKGGTFLDGTYAASEVGKIHDVALVTTDVDRKHGGLAAKLDGKNKVENSVRDVAVANGMLFVCNEPKQVINLYSLKDGSFLGASNPLSNSPTHLSIYNGGLYVSAGPGFYWAQLPASASSPTLKLQPTSLTPPAKEKIGGISFDPASSTVYVPFQTGTGGNNPGGSINTYTVTQQSPATLPVLSNQSTFVSLLPDTPEFVLYWS
jgi:hypothetical protein